jgi:hypothetical protein
MSSLSFSLNANSDTGPNSSSKRLLPCSMLDGKHIKLEHLSKIIDKPDLVWLLFALILRNRVFVSDGRGPLDLWPASRRHCRTPAGALGC